MKNLESLSDTGNPSAEAGSSLDVRALFETIDSLCMEVHRGLAGRRREVKGWPIERKRAFAAGGDDPYVLNLLSMDGDFRVRTLALCNPETPEHAMRRVVGEGATDYILMVIANNPNCPSDVLDRIVDLTREPEVLEAVKRHPNVLEVTKCKIEGFGG